MSRHEQRFNDYLGSYQFFPNSIEFRIASSKAMEKWKNVQSFQMNQLINGKFFFAQDRREILLLKYDMWSRWLVEVENLFIELHESSNSVKQKDIDLVIKLANKTAKRYIKIIKEDHSHHFEENFANMWLEVHETAYSYLVEKVRSLHGPYEMVFTIIVNILCEIMQYTLTELHELNEMFKHPSSDDIFLVVTPFCVDYMKDTGQCLIKSRLEIYKKYFDFSKVWFKNYINDPLPASIIMNVENLGLEIDYKKCLFN